MADIIKFISKNQEKIIEKKAEKKEKEKFKQKVEANIQKIKEKALSKGVDLTITHQTAYLQFKKNRQINEEQFLQDLNDLIEKNFN